MVKKTTLTNKEVSMKKIFTMTGIIMVLAFVCLGGALAGTNDPRIQNRMENQQARIEQGVNTGQLTPWEAGRLERQQSRIGRTEDKMKSDGCLTIRERARLHNRLNNTNRHIYRQRHDGQRRRR
jgi:hypothetical protein